jgi:hypothetical protein
MAILHAATTLHAKRESIRAIMRYQRYGRTGEIRVLDHDGRCPEKTEAKSVDYVQ